MKRLTLDDVICPVCCVLLPLDNDGCPECGHQDQLQGRIPPIRAYSDRLHYPGMRALIGRLQEQAEAASQEVTEEVLRRECVDLVKAGNVVAAVRRYRHATGCGLPHARRQLGLTWPSLLDVDPADPDFLVD
ncbi:hypothetical protein EJ607_03670 [Pseudomonas aeruginosa]|nr:hypothetical protein [Pseudomonas aeruginosa]RTA96146.1 hypothetical protein EJ607_03670 [Pseudomonas aeruginosa]